MKNHLYAERPARQWVERNDNPLITRLNIIKSEDLFHKKMQSRPDFEFDFINASLNTRKVKIERDLYLPDAMSWRIYKDIAGMIEMGYQDRNIRFPSYQKHMNEAIFNERSGGVIGAEDGEEHGVGGTVRGPAGSGKSRRVRQISGLFDKTITHAPKDTAYQKPFIQIPIIMVKVKSLSSRAILREILLEIDKRVGTPYYKDNPESKGVSRLLDVLKVACWTYAIGLIVIDEAQILGTTSSTTDRADVPNAKFLLSLFNTLQVPILLVGTPELRKLVSSSNHLLRRYEKNCRILINNFAPDDNFWNEMIDIHLQKFVFARPVNIDNEGDKRKSQASSLRSKIYVYTQGNLGALILFNQALIDCLEEEPNADPCPELFSRAFSEVRDTLLTLAETNRRLNLSSSPSESSVGRTTNSSPLPKQRANKRKTEPKAATDRERESSLSAGISADDLMGKL